MLSFREASIGQPILGLIVGIVLIIALPEGLAGVPTSAVGWIVGAWSLVWLLGEIIANGTARAQMNGNLMFREANMRDPSILGALGTGLLLLAPAEVAQIPLHTIGWIILGGAVLWLVLEAIANGVTRSRRRARQPQDPETSPRIL